MKQGKLIFVTGFFGSGKTTLVKAALDKIPILRYLKTYTTRPRREGEGDFEYNFVIKEEYEKLRTASKIWDHTLAGDNFYGADVEICNKLLSEGKSVVCCVAPDKTIIEKMSFIYKTMPILVWIDTPLSIANKRLLDSPDTLRKKDRFNSTWQSEENAKKVKSRATYIFIPTNNLENDKATFIELITKIIVS